MSAHTTIVIVSYRSMATIDAALSSLADAHAAGEVEVVVVDNASPDGTADHVREEWPWVELLALEENRGFAAGCNAGFARAATPYTMLLNPDAEIPREGIARLHRFMEERKSCGACAPALVHPGGVVQGAGTLTTPGTLLAQAFFGSRPPGERRIEPGSPAFQTTWICGGAFYVRSQALRDLGGMDDRFFLYFEETDLCRRILAAGWEIWGVGEAVARHVGGVSANQVHGARVNGCLSEYYFPSRFYYLSKNHGAVRAVLTEAIVFAVLCGRSVLARLRGREAPTIRARLAGGLFRSPPRVARTSDVDLVAPRRTTHAS